MKRYSKYIRPLSWRFLVITIFFMVAYVLVVYAQGYRIDFKTLSLQSTSAISITGDVTGVTVLVDNEPAGNQLPFSKVNLIPYQTYKIVITKPGYKIWQRDVIINPGSIASYGPVQLFPDKMTSSVTTNVDKQKLCSKNTPSNSQNLAINGGELRTGDKLLTRLSSVITDACWFGDGNHIAYTTGADIHIIEIDGGGDFVAYTAPAPIKSIAVEGDGSALYYTNQQDQWFIIGLHKNS